MRRALTTLLFLSPLLGVAHAPARAAAQSASISMSADRTQMNVGDTFRLQIRLEVQGANAPDATVPDLSAFEILSRQFSRPMSFRLGFGPGTQVVQSTVLHTFVLRARVPGRFDLEPSRAVVNGQQYQSNPLTIMVGGQAPGVPPTLPPQNVPGQSPVVGPSQGGLSPPQGELTGATYDDQAFIRTVVDRTEVFVGQQATVSIYLYTRSPLRASPVVTDEPSTDGFWVQDLLGQRSIEPSAQVIGSTMFRVYVMRRFAAFPVRAGELTITPMQAQIPSGNVFDVFAGPPPDLPRSGVPLTITARPLPDAGRPDLQQTSATDIHVGDLGLEARLDRAQVPTGDAVMLTLVATGTGRIEGLRIRDPQVDGIRVLSPAVQDELRVNDEVVAGIRTYEWLIVPEREGTYSIPPFTVAVFDPITQRYRVVPSNALTLTAAGNPLGAGEVEPEESAPSEELAIGPVRTSSALARARPRMVDRAWYPLTLLGVPVLAGLLVLAIAAARRAAERAASDTQLQASRAARRRLAAAEQARASGDKKAFYPAVSLAISSVIEGRLGESIGSLTHGQLRKRLIERGMSEELASAVIDELEALDFARFAASGGAASELEDVLARARALITRLDRFVATPPEGT